MVGVWANRILWHYGCLQKKMCISSLGTNPYLMPIRINKWKHIGITGCRPRTSCTNKTSERNLTLKKKLMKKHGRNRKNWISQNDRPTLCSSSLSDSSTVPSEFSSCDFLKPWKKKICQCGRYIFCPTKLGSSNKIHGVNLHLYS